MHLTLPQWILTGCVIAFALCVAIAAIRAGIAATKFKARAESTRAQINALHLERMSTSVNRVKLAFDNMPALAERADAAIFSINQSLQEIKLPEAVASLRQAAAAVKLLISGR